MLPTAEEEEEEVMFQLSAAEMTVVERPGGLSNGTSDIVASVWWQLQR